MPAHGPGANLPASPADRVLILERLAVQQRSIDAATRLLAAAKLKLREADDELTAAEVRIEAAEAVFDAAMSEYRREKRTHHKVDAGVFAAQALLDEAVDEASIIRAPFHPIRRTPLEVLGLIFELCVSPSPYWRDKQPLMLSHVCNLWRRAALMHPRVWSYIRLDFHRMARTVHAGRYQYLTNSLARSGTAPLHIYCTWRGMHHRNSEADALFIPALLPHLWRCESCILLGDDLGGDNVLPILRAQFPALRTLHLTRAPTEPWDGQVRFPVLADVRITGCRPSVISRLLEAAPAVLTLLWERDDEDFFLQADAESRSIPLVYPALKSLTLCGLVPFEINDLVRDIHFTALDTLALRGSDSRHWHADYIDTITRTTASLTNIHLTLSSPSKDSLDLLSTGLVRCPQLQRMELDAIFSRTGLQYFCDLFGRPLDDGSWLCPCLTVIDVTRCSLEGCIERIGHDACVRSRKGRSAGITSKPNSSGLRARIAALHLPHSDWECAELRTEVLSLLLALQ